MTKKYSRTRNSIKNISTSLINQLLLTVLKFICRTVFIQTLGKSYLGINGLFSDILTLLSITELGIDTAMNYKLYKPLAENDIPRLRVLMKFYKKAYVVIGLTITGLGLMLIPFLPNIIKDYDRLAPLGINPEFLFLLFLLRSAFSYLFFASASAIIKADQKEYVVYITNFICSLIMNIVQIITLLVWSDFLVYVIVAVVFTILQNLVNAFIAKKRYPLVFAKTSDRLSAAEIKDMFKDLGALSLGQIQYVVIKATDNLVLSAFIGLMIVGLYSNYLMIFNTIKTILNKIFSATRSSMGNLFTSDDVEKEYRIFSVMNFLTVFFYGTAAIGLAVVADELMLVWIGEEYIIPFPFTILMGIEILNVGMKNIISQVGDVAGVFRQMWYRPLIAIVLNITISVSLVQVCGIYGVLIGTIVSDLVVSLSINPIVIHKYAFHGRKPVSKYFLKNLTYFGVICLVGLCDWLLCHSMLVGVGWFSVIIHMMICGCSLPLVMVILFWRTEECGYIRQLMVKLIRKLKKTNN